MPKRRFSNVSDIETDPVCTMDPTFRQGRCTQLLGLTGLPLIPGIVLIIYCSIQLTDTARDFHVSKGVMDALEEIGDIWNLVLLLLEEMDGVVSLIAGNGTVILGQMEEFYGPTDASLKLARTWFEKADLDFISDLQIHRDNQVGLTNTSIYQEVNYYSDIVSDISDTIYVQLDKETKVVFWPNLVSYYSLLKALFETGIERCLGMVSYIQGYLTVNELTQYSAAFEVGQDHMSNALLYSSVVRSQYDLLFEDNYYLTDWLHASRTQILRNEMLDTDLFRSLVWYRKLTSLLNVQRNIERELALASQIAIKQSLERSIQTITFYVVVIFCLLFIISPFLFSAAYKTVSSLVHYAEITEVKNFELKREKRKTEALLNEMLPKAVAYRMRKGEEIEAESFDCVTIFFSDVTDFTEISMESDPIDIVLFLNEIYYLIDNHVGKYDVYKVETISASYMVVSGLPSRNGNRHSIEIARFSLDLMKLTQEFVIPHMPERTLQLRVGCHTGPVVSGVVGNVMPRYCLFGDTVNTASRMQSNGLARKIHLSQTTHKHLTENGGYIMEHRGTIQIKGKGAMNTYWLNGRSEKEIKKKRLDSMNIYERALLNMDEVNESAEEA